MASSLRLSRRTFITWVGATSTGFYLFGRLPGTNTPVVLAQVPGDTLDPTTIPKFAAPMLIPPVMPRAAVIMRRGGKPVDYYEISMRQFQQQILPPPPPANNGLGIRRERGPKQPWPAHSQRSLSDDRGHVESAGPDQMGQ